MSASTKRRPTCSTTCSCCCEAGDARSRTLSGCSMAAAPRASGASPRDRVSTGPGEEGDGPHARASGASVEPSLERVRALSRSHNLIPLSYSYIEDCETPVSAFLKLRALAPGEPAFLLESADQGQRVGRWSFSTTSSTR